MQQVYVSYFNDGGSHLERVIGFINWLRENGYHADSDVTVAQRETAPDFTRLMRQAISEEHKIIIVLSEGYKKQADKDEGKVGEEYNLVLRNIGRFPSRFILVSFDHQHIADTPYGLEGREVVILSGNEAEWKDELAGKLNDQPRYVITPVNPITTKVVPREVPAFNKASGNSSRGRGLIDFEKSKVATRLSQYFYSCTSIKCKSLFPVASITGRLDKVTTTLAKLLPYYHASYRIPTSRKSALYHTKVLHTLASNHKIEFAFSINPDEIIYERAIYSDQEDIMINWNYESFFLAILTSILDFALPVGQSDLQLELDFETSGTLHYDFNENLFGLNNYMCDWKFKNKRETLNSPHRLHTFGSQELISFLEEMFGLFVSDASFAPLPKPYLELNVNNAAAVISAIEHDLNLNEY